MPNRQMGGQTVLLAASGVGIALAVREALRRPGEADLTGQVALVTGGSRGLGFLLAREFARAGCRLVICARDEQELSRARTDLEQRGAEVLSVPCNVADQDQVERMIAEATRHFGRIDILVNNAGSIQAGPLKTMTHQDFTSAMDVMFWGVLHPTLAVLPQMRERQSGRIVNITSIGGKISVPHLLPYNAAKFAAVGLSEGLRAELAASGIVVTTIVPGLMRTGSHLNAYFKGEQEKEFTWFGLGASLPFISMDAERAAKQIVRAVRRGESERTFTIPANLAARFHGLFPGLTADLLGLVERLVLPGPDGAGTASERGMVVQRRFDSPVLDTLTALGVSAARRLNQFPGPSGAVVRGNGTTTSE
jgi:NAD(P)-dependent dehydrogenase (short-subunit alcohol dehydrogenase family)